jgi:long-chain fatty acid transport protein
MNKTFLLSALSLTLASSAIAGSFQLNLQGIRQTAMASSGTAKSWDAATLFYNPAGLSFMDRFQVYASGYMVSPRVGFSQYPTAGYQINAAQNTSTPFAVYLAGSLKKCKNLGFGLGVFTPFGSSIDWGNDWMGKYLIQNISLQTVQFQPTISYKFSDQISIGAGLNIGIGSMEINKALPLAFSDGSDATLNLKGDASGIGFNAGIMFKPTSDFHMGINYRHGLDMKVKDGTATFNVPQAAASNFPANGTTGFTTHLPLPHILTLGLAYDITSKFTVQSDIVYGMWQRYESLDFTFDETTAAVNHTQDKKNYKNTVALRFGANYKVIDELEVMAGFGYDPTPTSNSYMSPDAVDGNRWIYSLGVSYTAFGKLGIMAAAQYTYVGTRDVYHVTSGLHGAYQLRGLTPSLGLTYKF